MTVDDDGGDDDDDDLKVLWKEEGIKIGVQSHIRNHQLIFWQKNGWNTFPVTKKNNNPIYVWDEAFYESRCRII